MPLKGPFCHVVGEFLPSFLLAEAGLSTDVGFLVTCDIPGGVSVVGNLVPRSL